ncbi:unnamed protein product, partial [Effrenium voratum]
MQAARLLPPRSPCTPSASRALQVRWRNHVLGVKFEAKPSWQMDAAQSASRSRRSRSRSCRTWCTWRPSGSTSLARGSSRRDGSGRGPVRAHAPRGFHEPKVSFAPHRERGG